MEKASKSASSVTTTRFASIAIVLLGIASGIAMYTTLQRITSFSLILNRTVTAPFDPYANVFFSLSAIMIWWVVYRHFRRADRSFDGKEMLRLFWPVLPLILLEIIPPGVYSPLAAIGLTGLAILRGVWWYTGARPAAINSKRPSDWLIPTLVVALTVGMIAIGYTRQVKAWNTLYLFGCDWADYLAVTDHTLKGKWFLALDGKENFLASHFSPGSILLLCPYVWLFHSVPAFFLLNSLIIYSVAPLLYWLGRVLGLSRGQAGTMAFCALLSPSLLNLNLTLFYSFHDIYLLIPLIIMFFIAQEKKWWVISFACFGLSLLVKETVPVFWAGLALVFFFQGRRRTGTAMFLISVIYWLLVMKIFIPALSIRTTYDYASRFAHLGSSTWEIALSPFLRPGVFLTYLLRPNCLYFAAMLLMPVLFLVINRPWLLLGAGVIFTFICVQDSNQLQNIHMQYQTETLTLILVCAVYNLHWLNQGKTTPWYRFLSRDIRFPVTPSRMARGALLTTLFTAAAMCFFYGETSWGKNPLNRLNRRTDYSPQIEQLQQLIPPGASLQTTLNLAGHFLLRNAVRNTFDDPPADFVLMDLNTQDAQIIDRTRRNLLRSGYRVIASISTDYPHFVLFARSSEQPAISDQLTTPTEEQWLNSGELLPEYSTPDFEVRAATMNMPGPMLKLGFRLMRPTKCDFDFFVTVQSPGQVISSFHMTFGNGVTPAFMAHPGQTFFIILPLPPNGLEALKVRIVPRPEID